MNYEAVFAEQLDGLREAGNYRVFAELERQAGQFPRAKRWTEDGAVQDVTSPERSAPPDWVGVASA